MLGAILLLLTVAVSSSPIIVGGLGALGLFLVHRWKWAGWLFATTAMLISLSLSFNWYDLGVIVSCISSLFIAMLYVEEEADHQALLEHELARVGNEALEREALLNEGLRNAQEDYSREVDKVFLFERRLEGMREELNGLRVDHYQLSLLALPPRPVEPPTPDPLYAELRKQFAEKSAVLDTTRRELFHTENRLLALEKEGELSRLEPTAEEELLTLQLSEALERTLALEQEVADLHQLIFSLITPKKGAAKVKKSGLLQTSFI